MRARQPISFIGAGSGAGGTMLYHSTSESSTILRVTGPPDGACGVLIQGIRFSGKAPDEPLHDASDTPSDTGLYIETCAGFQVTESRFEHFGYAGLQVRHVDDRAQGIIYGNTFYRNLLYGLGYGVVVYGTNQEWMADPAFGTDNFIFVEDNDFEQHRHALAGGGAGRYVARHNLIRENLLGHAIDMHEARGGPVGNSNHFSTRAVEVYENELTNTLFRSGDPIGNGTEVADINDLSGWAMMFRGGEAVVFNNRIDGYIWAVGLTTYDDNYEPVYPIFTQIGYASALSYGAGHTGVDADHGNGDFFEWNNTTVSYTSPNYPDGLFYLKNHAPDYLQEGRDYHISTPKADYTAYPYPHPDRWTF